MTISSEYGGWAYLKLTSQEPLSAIREHIGSTGDGRSWTIGDRARNGQAYRFSLWTLDSGLERGEPLDAHVRALWKRVEKIRPALCNLPEEITGVVQCVGHFKNHNGACTLSGGHFATAAYYRLSWDFDFYFDDNFGHEEEGNPYWAW